MVWAMERYSRHQLAKMKKEDREKGFKIHHQELMFNDTYLEPHYRPLDWFNISDYDLVYVLPKIEYIEDKDNKKKQALLHDYLGVINIHERFKAWEDMEDSNEEDPVYRELKQVYIETEKECFQDCARNLQLFPQFYKDVKEQDPNIGRRPMPHMDQQWRLEMEEQFRRLETEEFHDEVANETITQMLNLFNPSPEIIELGRQQSPQWALEVMKQHGLGGTVFEEFLRQAWPELGNQTSQVEEMQEDQDSDADGLVAGNWSTFDIPQDLLQKVTQVSDQLRKRIDFDRDISKRERRSHLKGDLPGDQEDSMSTSSGVEGQDHDRIDPELERMYALN